MITYDFSFNPDAQHIVADPLTTFPADALPSPGESPRYDARTESIYISDIDGCRVYAVALDGAIKREYVLPERAGMLALSTSVDKIVVAQERDLRVLDLQSGKLSDLVSGVEPVDEQRGARRLNDGDLISFEQNYKDNPLHGKLLVGGISEAKPARTNTAGLFIVDQTGARVRLLDGLVNSNGIGTYKNMLVHTDTGTGVVTFYEVGSEIECFELKPTVAIDFSKNLSAEDSLTKDKCPGPDGLVVDADESMILVALFRAGKIVGINPANGEHVLTIEVPAPQTAACELAQDQLIITTGGGGRDRYCDAGAIFSVSMQSFGLRGKTRGYFPLS